jgi:hypothetical protein
VYSGFVNYFAVPGNMHTLKSFNHQLVRIWLKALRRRSQKGRRMTWEKFERIAKGWIPLPKCKHPWPNQRFGRYYPRQEPYAVVPHVRVCAGGCEQSQSLPRPHFYRTKKKSSQSGR